MYRISTILTLFLLLLLCVPARSQEVADEFPITPDSVLLRADSVLQQVMPAVLPADTTFVVSAETDSLARRGLSAIQAQLTYRKPDPKRALWLALVLPGAGQIYNRKYWKLPIIYGGFLGCAYALSWNNQMLRDYSQAYLDIMDSDPQTTSYEKMLPLNYNISGREEQFKEIFKNKKNYYRKYRDMSIFAFIGVYAISVIDAYVDAELSSFDISEDLSLQVTPAVISGSSPTLSQATPRRHTATFCQDTGLGMALRLHF